MSTTNVSIPVFIKKGLKANLNKAQFVDGVLYFTTDTSELFFDDNQEGRFQIIDTDAIQFLKQGEISFGKQYSGMHLYGTPSATGNIGLRNGKNVTLYDGYVLSDIDTVYTAELKKQYPYMYLTTIWVSFLAIQLIVTAEPLAVVDSDYFAGFERYISSVGKQIACKSWERKLYNEDGWQDYYMTMVSGQSTHIPFWSNTDMEKYMHNSGTTGISDDIYTPTGKIGFAASEPIPVADIVGCNCNGIMLPDIDTVYTDELKQTYPYMIAYHHFFGGIFLCISKDPWVGTGELYDTEYPECGEKIVTGSSCIYFSAETYWSDLNIPYYTWEAVDTSVEEVTTVWGQMFDGDGDGIVDRGTQCAFWSNRDIISADGNTVLIAKSEPIPIYELKEEK